MCTWFYADYHSLSYFISKAQQLPLADEMMRVLSKKMAMSGNIRPTDMAAVLAPNKKGNMAVFPMVWGFMHEATDKPIVNCRVESADQKAILQLCPFFLMLSSLIIRLRLIGHLPDFFFLPDDIRSRLIHTDFSACFEQCLICNYGIEHVQNCGSEHPVGHRCL